MWAGICANVSVVAYFWTCIQRPEEDTECLTRALSLSLTPFREGLSLNLELGWQPGNTSDPLIPVCVSVCVCVCLSVCVCTRLGVPAHV